VFLAVTLVLVIIFAFQNFIRQNVIASASIAKNEIATGATVEAYLIAGMIVHPVVDNIVQSLILAFVQEALSDTPVTGEVQSVKLHVVGDGTYTVPGIHNVILKVSLQEIEHLFVVGNVNAGFVKHM
jgi:hypothetical protein